MDAAFLRSSREDGEIRCDASRVVSLLSRSGTTEHPAGVVLTGEKPVRNTTLPGHPAGGGSEAARRADQRRRSRIRREVAVMTTH
jgi:acyl-CoA synthetase (AMP-forming)/AMP-acid ligase II